MDDLKQLPVSSFYEKLGNWSFKKRQRTAKIREQKKNYQLVTLDHIQALTVAIPYHILKRRSDGTLFVKTKSDEFLSTTR